MNTVHKPQLHLPEHQRRLKKALLSHFGAAHPYYMFLSRFAPVASLAFAFIFALSVIQQPDAPSVIVPSASAEEILNDSLNQIQSLSPEELADLQTRLGNSYFVDLYQEAQNASDLDHAVLELISCGEAKSVDSEPRTAGISSVSMTSTEQDEACQAAATISWNDFKILLTSSQPDLNDMPVSGYTYLGFTRPDGTPVIMILNQELLPDATFEF